LDEITRIMESGDAVDIIYLDFRKAFDFVSHGRLLIKLQTFGIVGNLLKIVEDFLSDRWMAVPVGSATSSWKQVTSGLQKCPKVPYWGTYITLYISVSQRYL
jgi:hypothetical protein